MKFNSQICTTREQSERLIALGLKKETADCGIYYSELMGDDRIFVYVGNGYEADEIPAWSLHRLIEMMPYSVEVNNKTWTLQVSKGYARYGLVGMQKSYVGFIQRPNTYDAIIDCIEWLIKEGEFEKEYLQQA